MSPSSETPYKLFRISSVPTAQPAFAICTVYRNPGGYLKAECFVLFQTSPSDGVAYGSRFSYSDDSEGDSPVAMDEAFAMDDVIQQAESMYSTKAHELDPHLYDKLGWGRPIFAEIPQHRLVGIWAHTPLSRHLLDIADKSDCVQLTEYIYSLRALPTIQKTPLAL